MNGDETQTMPTENEAVPTANKSKPWTSNPVVWAVVAVAMLALLWVLFLR